MNIKKPSRKSNLGELIDQFTEAVNSCLGWNKSIEGRLYSYKVAKQTRDIVVLHPDLAEKEAKELFDLHKKRNTALLRVGAIGQKLAEAVNMAREDPEGVLKIVHCCGASGGGADCIVPLWPEVAPKLAAMLLPKPMVRSNGKAKAGRKDETSEIAEFAQARRIRTPPMLLKAIVAEWRMENPSDNRVPKDLARATQYVREAIRRHYGDKSEPRTKWADI